MIVSITPGELFALVAAAAFAAIVVHLVSKTAWWFLAEWLDRAFPEPVAAPDDVMALADSLADAEHSWPGKIVPGLSPVDLSRWAIRNGDLVRSERPAEQSGPRHAAPEPVEATAHLAIVPAAAAEDVRAEPVEVIVPVVATRELVAGDFR